MAKTFKAATDLAYGKVYEEPAARVFAQKQWPGSEIRPAGRFADIDFLVFAGPEGVSNGRGGLKHLPGEFIAFLEIKKRRKVAASWPSTIVHVNKHNAGRYGKAYFKVPTVCLVLFTDTAGWFYLNEAPDSVEDIERWDRPGVSVPHACYLYSRMTWDTDLLPEVMTAIAADEGEATTEEA